MKTYLVGGAVRDKLLGFPCKEKDWVVVGASPAEMLSQGFRSVGKDFPVFLHPETNEEYALARTERKVGRGYTGFDFNTSSAVTLEEDLQRRDLTINAMAETADGDLIDPYHGKQDLENKILRHVSPAFIEDPVRVLRVARFMARYAHLGFQIAPETLQLMKKMVQAGEIDALTSERVWKELERALAEKNPEQFFNVLSECGALEKLFPEIKLTGEGMQFLKKFSETSILNNSVLNNPIFKNALTCFVLLFHATSPQEIQQFCKKYRIPNQYLELATLVATHLKNYPQPSQLNPAYANNILEFLIAVDAFRRTTRFEQFLQICEFVTSFQSEQLIKKCYLAAQSIRTGELIKQWQGKALGEQINLKRLDAIVALLKGVKYQH